MINIVLKNDAGDYYKLELFNETWIKNLSNCWVMLVNRAHQAQNIQFTLRSDAPATLIMA